MMKHRYTFAAIAAFAFMFASPALADLPRPTTATFAKGAKFTIAGYTNVNGTARSTALDNFPVLVRLAAGSPSGFSYDDLTSSTGDDLCFINMEIGRAHV